VELLHIPIPVSPSRADVACLLFAWRFRRALTAISLFPNRLVTDFETWDGKFLFMSLLMFLEMKRVVLTNQPSQAHRLIITELAILS